MQPGLQSRVQSSSPCSTTLDLASRGRSLSVDLLVQCHIVPKKYMRLWGVFSQMQNEDLTRWGISGLRTVRRSTKTDALPIHPKLTC